MSKAKFVNDIKGIVDPDTLAEVDMCLYKHENGGMFAIDFSFLDQVAQDTENGYIISDPFNEDERLTLVHENDENDDYTAWSENFGEGNDPY